MKWVVLAHIMSGATWFGGQVFVEALMASAVRTGDPETIMTIGVRVGKTSSRIFSIAGILAVIFGVWIVLNSLYTFEMLFVTLGFAFTIIALSWTLRRWLLRNRSATSLTSRRCLSPS